MKDLQVVAALQQCRDLYQKDTKDVVSSYEKKKKELGKKYENYSSWSW